METIITRQFKGIDIIFNNLDYVDATDVCRKFAEKGIATKAIADYLRRKRTQELADNIPNWLTEEEKQKYEQLIIVVRGGGNDQGTWLHPYLAIDFAAWLNIDFHIWMLRITSKLLTEGHVDSSEIKVLQQKLNLLEGENEGLNNDNGLLRYQVNQLNYENDELSEIANFRRLNSWVGSDV